MQVYIIRRVLLIIPTLLLITVFVFLSVRFVPASVIDLMLADMIGQTRTGEEEARAYLQEALGLDKPIHVQYAEWLSRVVKGDLGESLWTKRDIKDEMLAKLPISVELGLIAIITGLLISLPIGVYSAIRQDTLGDYVGRTIAILGISVPGFWVATMIFVFPSIYLNWTPEMKYIPFFDDPARNLLQFVIPGVVMAMAFAGGIMRLMRTMMLEVLRQDYVRTAWSKGLKERVIIYKHAMKNALIPVVTVIGMQLPVLIGGAVIIEQIFALPGIGRYLFEAVNRRDYPIITGINLVIATVILFINLIVDITYSYLDPRIRYK
jgi:peptide/nickel transport system permease protein